MFWVLLGYALGTSQGLGIVPFIRLFKIIFLIASLIYILYLNGLSTFFIINTKVIYSVIIAVTFFSFFSDKPFQALYKSLTFIYPFIYILFSINYLLKYGAFNVLIALSMAIMLCYLIVPLSYYIVGGSLFNSVNIYGYTEGDYFVSNHYGWGCALFILSSLTLLRFYPLKYIYRILIYISLPLTLYLLIISANRAGILSVFISIILFFVMDKNATVLNKITLMMVTLLIIFFISLTDNSVIEFLKVKNEVQIETGAEGRLIGTNAMLQSFNQNPIYWFTGVGMFNYTELKLNGGILGAYHNSYWEILFGSGVIVFILFLKFMVLQPIRIFWKITISYSLLIIPLILIPFFEGNLTAGQFLFFPWFSYMILLNSKEFSVYSN